MIRFIIVCYLSVISCHSIAHQSFAKFHSKTSRKISFYLLNNDIKDIDGKTEEEIRNVSMGKEKHYIIPHHSLIQSFPYKKIWIAVAREGKSLVSKTDLGKKFIVCGPIKNLDKVTVFTRKKLSFDAGSACKISHNDSDAEKYYAKQVTQTPLPSSKADEIVAEILDIEPGKGAVMKIIVSPQRDTIGKLVFIHPDKIHNNSLKKGSVVVLGRILKKLSLSKGCENFTKDGKAIKCDFGALKIKDI